MVHFWRIALLQLYFIIIATWLRVLRSGREMSGNLMVLESGHPAKVVPHPLHSLLRSGQIQLGWLQSAVNSPSGVGCPGCKHIMHLKLR